MSKIMKSALVTFFLVLTTSSLFAFEGPSILPANLSSIIQKEFPGFRIAQKSDFILYLQKMEESSNTVLEGDLNQDGKTDYTILLINKPQRIFGFYSFISNSISYSTFALSTSSWPEDYEGKIWEIMWFKKSGEPGISDEKYFNAPGKPYPYLNEYTEKDINKYKEAVKKYVSLNAIEKTGMEYSPYFDEEDIFYCKTIHYFEDNEMKSEGKCD